MVSVQLNIIGLLLLIVELFTTNWRTVLQILDLMNLLFVHDIPKFSLVCCPKMAVHLCMKEAIAEDCEQIDLNEW